MSQILIYNEGMSLFGIIPVDWRAPAPVDGWASLSMSMKDNMGAGHSKALEDLLSKEDSVSPGQSKAIRDLLSKDVQAQLDEVDGNGTVGVDIRVTWPGRYIATLWSHRLNRTVAQSKQFEVQDVVGSPGLMSRLTIDMVAHRTFALGEQVSVACPVLCDDRPRPQPHAVDWVGLFMPHHPDMVSCPLLEDKLMCCPALQVLHFLSLFCASYF